MNREELERLRAQAGEAAERIEELRREIAHYKGRAESLKEATERLEELAEKVGSLVGVVEGLAGVVEAETRETRREIREARAEILEELEARGRKGFRLFGKKREL